MAARRIRTHTDLDVYRLALQAAMGLFGSSKMFTTEERYSLIDQVRRSSRSVCANIAEAWRKRRYQDSFILKLNDAEAEAAETQTWISFAARCGYLSLKEADKLIGVCDQIIGKLVWMIQDPSKCLIRRT